MNVREEVRQFVAMGPLPDSASATDEQLVQLEAAFNKIAAPVTRDEAELLMMAFGPDECFGAGFALLHLIETAPGGPMLSSPPPPGANEWLHRMWTGIENARRWGLIK